MKRREFLKRVAGVIGAAALGKDLAKEISEPPEPEIKPFAVLTYKIEGSTVIKTLTPMNLSQDQMDQLEKHFQEWSGMSFTDCASESGFKVISKGKMLSVAVNA